MSGFWSLPLPVCLFVAGVVWGAAMFIFAAVLGARDPIANAVLGFLSVQAGGYASAAVTWLMR